MITWKETIDIIREAFEIDQKQLAIYLHINESDCQGLEMIKQNLLSPPIRYSMMYLIQRTRTALPIINWGEQKRNY